MSAACLPDLSPQSYRPHALHDAARAWPETNCYVDLWIELLASIKLEPRAALSFTVLQDFEGDQIGFFKIPHADLETLYGLKVLELAIFDAAETHVALQVQRERLCMIELDGYFLPDTQGVAYRTEHGKTTVGVNRIDCSARRMEYFHNGGYFALEGDDFDGLFRRGTFARGADDPFLPYCEFVKLDGRKMRSDLLATSLNLFRSHLVNRPAQNPIAAFIAVFADQARAIAEKSDGFFHKYAFNTLRQLGANFELLADYLQWLEEQGESNLASERADAKTIADAAKIAQFQLARAVARNKFDALTASLAPAAKAWPRMMTALAARYGV